MLKTLQNDPQPEQLWKVLLCCIYLFILHLQRSLLHRPWKRSSSPGLCGVEDHTIKEKKLRQTPSSLTRSLFWHQDIQWHTEPMAYRTNSAFALKCRLHNLESIVFLMVYFLGWNKSNALLEIPCSVLVVTPFILSTVVSSLAGDRPAELCFLILVIPRQLTFAGNVNGAGAKPSM